MAAITDFLERAPELVQEHPLGALAVLFGFIFLMLGLTLHLTTRDPR